MAVSYNYLPITWYESWFRYIAIIIHMTWKTLVIRYRFNFRRWAKPDNEKLARLFRTRVNRADVSSTDINQKSIKKVISKHFLDRTYNAFSPLFRKKACAFTLDQVLSGKRVCGSNQRSKWYWVDFKTKSYFIFVSSLCLLLCAYIYFRY